MKNQKHTPEPLAERAAKNTDLELYREPDKTGAGDYYSDSIHVTESGGIGINVGGYVIVKPLRDWHACVNAMQGIDEAFMRGVLEFFSGDRPPHTLVDKILEHMKGGEQDG